MLLNVVYHILTVFYLIYAASYPGFSLLLYIDVSVLFPDCIQQNMKIMIDFFSVTLLTFIRQNAWLTMPHQNIFIIYIYFIIIPYYTLFCKLTQIKKNKGLCWWQHFDNIFISTVAHFCAFVFRLTHPHMYFFELNILLFFSFCSENTPWYS